MNPPTVTASGQCLGTTFETRVQTWGSEVRYLYRCTTCDRVFRTTRSHPAPGPTTRSHDKTMQSLFAFADTPAPQFRIIFDAEGEPHTECPICFTQDEIKEQDAAIRWNTLHLSEDGKSATASTGYGDFDGDGFICTSCLKHVAEPDDFEITEWY